MDLALAGRKDFDPTTGTEGTAAGGDGESGARADQGLSTSVSLPVKVLDRQLGTGVWCSGERQTPEINLEARV